jgi:copper(I)-binding protein
MIRTALLLLALLPSGIASAADLSVNDAWIRRLPGGAPAAGYFSLRNDGQRPVELVGAESAAFGHVMMHRTVESDGVSRMRPVAGIEVPAAGTVVFAPGGYHLMLTDPAGKIAIGDRVTIFLKFSDGRRLDATFEVRGPTGN